MGLFLKENGAGLCFTNEIEVPKTPLTLLLLTIAHPQKHPKMSSSEIWSVRADMLSCKSTISVYWSTQIIIQLWEVVCCTILANEGKTFYVTSRAGGKSWIFSTCCGHEYLMTLKYYYPYYLPYTLLYINFYIFINILYLNCCATG